MKRFLLFGLVLAAVLWTLYSGYDLFLYKGNTIAPKRVFCEQDESILVVNRVNEIKEVDYFELVDKNPYVNAVKTLDTKPYSQLKIYLSGSRPILILEKESVWKESEVETISNHFKDDKTSLTKEENILLISTNFSSCESDTSATDFFIEGDKKASANFWLNQKNGNWKRTDVYALDKGFFEYRSSQPIKTYGNAVNDISTFAPVLPSNISTYNFNERFFAENNDSIFANNLMSSWVDLGFVMATYEDETILISDYRSQQEPGLILLEKSESEDSVKIMDDLRSFTGFQFTKDFPKKPKGRVYLVELEDKVVFTEKESIARQILVDYQLGKTLTLNPTRKEQFFGGLPAQVNHRAIDNNEKNSLTWKKKLLFEVSTKPPGERIVEAEKTNWSIGLEASPKGLIPIPDHLRNGTSVFVYDKNANYKLISPNGKTIWKGRTNKPIEGKPIVIDVFENKKHQVLFRTENSVYLIDLNGNSVGGFPYKSDSKITSDLSEFIWNGTKRFVFGSEKGEITMLNSAGQELTIIKVGKSPINTIPYALNVGGALRVWVSNQEKKQFLAYLETPASPESLEKKNYEYAIKIGGTVKFYFENEGKVYSQSYMNENSNFIGKGKLLKVDKEYIYLKDNNNIQIYDHNNNLRHSQNLSFNEVGSLDFFKYNDTHYTVIMDYLQNKINLFNDVQENIEGFPKEGREKAISYFHRDSKTMYIYTLISKSIVCYKIYF